MLDPSYENEISSQLHKLNSDQQRLVLALVQALGGEEPAGVPGNTLLRFAGTIEQDDLELMKLAIEDGCEQVNPHDW